MSDDIFNENNRKINWGSVLLVSVLIIVIIGIGLYSTGHLNISSGNNVTLTNNTISNNQNNNTGVTTEELTQNETQEIKNSVVKVLVPKYIVYKTKSGDVLGVTGFIAIKTTYFKGMDDSVVIGLKNYPVRKTVINKQLYSKDYHGYVIYKFTITFKDSTDKELQNLKILQLLVIYNNIPYTFNLNMNKNVKWLKSNFEVTMNYNLPTVSNTPVQASVTFNIITNSQSILNKIKTDIMNNYQSSYILLEGDEKYFVRASTYTENPTSITIQYISSPDVMTGVYTATLHYKLLGNTYNKKIKKILVDNPNSYPDFISVGLLRTDNKININKINGKYWVLLQVNDTTSRVSLPQITAVYYDYNLNKIADVVESNVEINFGTNIITLQVPETMITKPGQYYMILKITAPNSNKYSILFRIDTTEINLKTTENNNIANITYMIYPQEDYYNPEYFITQNTSITGKIPILLFYLSDKKTINVKVTTGTGTQTVTLEKLIDYRLQSGEVVPLYGGFFTVINEKPVSNYVITLTLPNGEKVWGSVDLLNIIMSGKEINSLFNKEIIKTNSASMSTLQTEELTAYKIIAVAKGITTEYDISELLSNLLSHSIILTSKDIQVTNNKVIIHIDDGTSGKLMSSDFILYKSQVMTMLRNIQVIVRQNENLYYSIIFPSNAVYENKSIILNLPFINKINHVYLNINGKILPLSKFSNMKQNSGTSITDYTYYTYIDPSIGLDSEDKIYSLYNTAFRDNPVSREILLEKLNTVGLVLSYTQSEQGSNYNETMNNETIHYNETVNTSASIIAGEGENNGSVSYMHIYIGLDSKPNGDVSFTVNNHKIPATMTVHKYLDFYLIDVKFRYDDFESAMAGVTLNDIITGKQLTELKLGNHIYINIFPGDVPVRGFLISNRLLFINSEGYNGVLYCGSNELKPLYSANSNGFTGSVYQLQGNCDLRVKSDYFGEFKVLP